MKLRWFMSPEDRDKKTLQSRSSHRIQTQSIDVEQAGRPAAVLFLPISTSLYILRMRFDFVTCNQNMFVFMAGSFFYTKRRRTASLPSLYTGFMLSPP